MAIIGNLISCTMAAYAFGRLKFVGRGFWFAVMMIALMLPGQVTIVPRYIPFNTFGWVGSYLPILAPKFLATDAFFVFLLVQFIRSLPKELDEAAIIDGCGKVGVFLRIIVPLATPALVTIALFTFLWTWDDFMYRIYNAVADRTIPQGPNLPNDQGFVNELRLIGQAVGYGRSTVEQAAADFQALIERLAVK